MLGSSRSPQISVSSHCTDQKSPFPASTSNHERECKRERERERREKGSVREDEDLREIGELRDEQIERFDWLIHIRQTSLIKKKREKVYRVRLNSKFVFTEINPVLFNICKVATGKVYKIIF